MESEPNVEATEPLTAEDDISSVNNIGHGISLEIHDLYKDKQSRGKFHVPDVYDASLMRGEAVASVLLSRSP